jgi:hypothetical protein
MYKEHPSFNSISDDTKIWRFMDLAKFCDVLEKNSLFFVKPEKFRDPWEGYLPKKHFEEASYSDIPADVGKVLIKLAKETTPNLFEEILGLVAGISVTLSQKLFGEIIQSVELQCKQLLVG